VFRNLRRLGVQAAQLDDALQDVFLVALRHIDKYVEGTHGKAWLFAIALRVGAQLSTRAAAPGGSTRPAARVRRVRSYAS